MLLVSLPSASSSVLILSSSLVPDWEIVGVWPCHLHGFGWGWQRYVPLRFAALDWSCAGPVKTNAARAAINEMDMEVFSIVSSFRVVLPRQCLGWGRFREGTTISTSELTRRHLSGGMLAPRRVQA